MMGWTLLRQSSGRLSARKVAAMGEIFGVKTAWPAPTTFRRSATLQT